MLKVLKVFSCLDFIIVFPSMQILTNAQQEQITVMTMQVVPTMLEDLHVHVMLVTLEVVFLVQVISSIFVFLLHWALYIPFN